MLMKQRKSIRIIFGLFLVAVLLLGLVWFSGQRNVALEFIALDIGQGDAILIKTPYHQNILVDGGPDNSVIYRLSKNLPFYDRTIDLMILTHPDTDHVTGLVEVLKRYKVKEILYNGVSHSSPNYLQWIETAEEKRVPMKIGQTGQVIIFGEGLRLDILYPEHSYSGQEIEDMNDTSIVAKLIYKDTTFMLTGDASVKVEKELMDEEVNLKSDVLKVGHHGSKTCTCKEFVRAVNPQYAVISVGQDNKFGHPSLRVIRNLEKEGVEILRTDESGDVILISDGEEVRRP